MMRNESVDFVFILIFDLHIEITIIIIIPLRIIINFLIPINSCIHRLYLAFPQRKVFV